MFDRDTVVIYDLEWTSWPGFLDSNWTLPGKHREILQIGAVRLDVAAGFAELAAVDPASAERIHPNDERRIIRALEVYRLAGKPLSELQTQWEANRPKLNAVRIGIRRERELQNRKTNARAKAMLEAGLVDEVRALYDDPQGLSETARLAVGYAELFPYFEGKTTLDKAIERIKINTRQLAKKQRTWHRRWADVQWFDVAEDDTAESVAARVLAKVEVR